MKMTDMSHVYELPLTHGEINARVEFFDKKIVNRWGGQDVIYRYVVKLLEGFDEVEVMVSAVVINEPYIEFEFVDANPLEDKDFILGSTEDKPDGFTNTTAGEMVEELTEKHEFLYALTQAFYRNN